MVSSSPNSLIQSPASCQDSTHASSLVAQARNLLQNYRNEPINEIRGYPHSLRETATNLMRLRPLEDDIEVFRLPGLRGRTFYRASPRLVSETYFVVDRLETVLTETSTFVAELVEHKTRLPTYSIDPQDILYDTL